MLILLQHAIAQSEIDLNRTDGKYNIARQVTYFNDTAHKFSIKEVAAPEFHSKFTPIEKNIFFGGITSSAHWFHFKIKNNDPARKQWYLLLDFAQTGHIDLYDRTLGDSVLLYRTGFLFPFAQRPVTASPFAFPISNTDTTAHDYYMRVFTNRTAIVPLYVITQSEFLLEESNDNIRYGIYFGILFGLLFYNLFLFIGLRDRTYLFYVFSILSTVMVFSGTSGKSLQFVFYNYPGINRMLIEVGSCMLSASTALFAISFLRIREYSKLLYYGLVALIAVAAISFVLLFFINIRTVQDILYPLLSVQVLVLLASGIVSYLHNNRFAGYYIIAWIGYMVGGVITMGRDQGFLAFNQFTSHASETGSAMEVILLSLALSRRYQLFRKEKEQAIERTLLIQKEANETLEQKVRERTAELEQTLLSLKEAQSQLVQAEKMASLGQVTAGIAHEINNPINFITGSLPPLRQDISDILSVIDKFDELIPSEKKAVAEMVRKEKELKFAVDEINNLLKGIEIGANRTSTIVKDLRSFSGLDESEVSLADVNHELDIILDLRRSEYEGRISIRKEYGNIPTLKCNARDLNQVYEQILMNAVQAITGEGEIFIRTWNENGFVKISFKDNGPGIPAAIKSKIFDPFFTTKDVGKGKGLGLNIVYGIIKKHSGNISVVSEEGKGAEFVISLPC